MQSFVTQSLHLSNFRIQWKHRGAKTSLRFVAPCHSVQLQERIRRLGPVISRLLHVQTSESASSNLFQFFLLQTSCYTGISLHLCLPFLLNRGIAFLSCRSLNSQCVAKHLAHRKAQEPEAGLSAGCESI